jgi:hypothetical protein
VDFDGGAMGKLWLPLLVSLHVSSASVASAADLSPCEVFFDARIDTCVAAEGKLTDDAAANADVVQKKADVATKQTAFDTAPADKCCRARWMMVERAG